MEEKTNKKINIKEKICLTFFNLVKNEDYKQINVKEISKCASVSRMTFYRYFKNKDDIFIYYADERFQEYVNEISKLKYSTLKDNIYRLLLLIEQNRSSIELLIKAGRYELMFTQFETYFSYIWHHFKLGSQVRQPILNKYAVSFISGGIYSATFKWVTNNCKDEALDITNALLEIFRKYFGQIN